MLLKHYLFGDFAATFHTLLSIPNAAGKLARISDQSFSRQAKPLLHGYATTHEVVLWEDNEFFVNPFRPHFRGTFSQEHGVTVLSGVFRAHWFTKIWCTVMAIGGLSALYLGLTGQLTQDPLQTLAVVAIAATSFLQLRLSIRPGSRMLRSLSEKIEAAISNRPALYTEA